MISKLHKSLMCLDYFLDIIALLFRQPGIGRRPVQKLNVCTVVTYGNELWGMDRDEIESLRIFQSKVSKEIIKYQCSVASAMDEYR